MHRLKLIKSTTTDALKRVKKSLSRSNSPEPGNWPEADSSDDRLVVPQATHHTPTDSNSTSFIVLTPSNSTNTVAEDSAPTITIEVVEGNPESLGPPKIPFNQIGDRNPQHDITVLRAQKSISRSNSPEPSIRSEVDSLGDCLVVPEATHHASTDSDSTSPIVLTPSNSTNSVAQDPITVERKPGPPKVPFNPIVDRNPQHDIAVLHVAFVLGRSDALQALILRVVKLSNKPSSKNLADPCIQFTIQLIGALDAKVDGVEEAIATFSKTVENAIAKDSSETQMAPHSITDSIKSIETTYPNIARTVEEKHSNRFSTIASGVLGVALPMLDIIKEGCSLIPVPMVQPLIGIVAGFLKAADEASNNFECMRWLSATVAKYVVRIAMACPREMEERWTQAVNTLQRELSGIVQDAEKFSRRSIVSRFMQHRRDKDDIARIKENLKAAMDTFNAEVNLNIKLDLDTISRKIDNVLLDKLERISWHSDSNGQYFSDSRKQEIQDALRWIEDTSGKHFLWIHGAAGVGKSTFARELLDHLKREGILATFASFIFGIGSKPKELVRMMARELCSLHPGCQPAIARAVMDCFGEHEHLIKYLDHFLVRPITSLAYAGPLVIILDALDECAYRQEFLKDLFQVDLPSNLKIILTSRYLEDIQFIAGDAAQPRELTPVSNVICRDYFVDKFQHIDWEEHEPEPFMFDKLVELADGLLIWAATVCTLVSTPSPDKSPIEILDEILSSSFILAREVRMETLYRMALERLFSDATPASKESQIFLSMAALKEPLPLKQFARLVGIRAPFIRDTYSKSRALQTRGVFDDDTVQPAIKLFHASFIDFLGHDQARNVMVDNCTRFFFKPTSEQGVVGPKPLLFREAEMYLGKHWVDHLREGTPEKRSKVLLEATSDQLRLWVAWSFSHLVFLEEERDYRPSPEVLQTLSIALLSAQGMSYSPETLSHDLSTTQAIVANFRQALDYGGLEYCNLGFYTQNRDYIRRWAFVINGLAIGLQHIHRLSSESDLTPLNTAIDVLDNLVVACPEDLQQHPSFMDNLGFALYSRSKLRCSRDDLERAIDFHTQAQNVHMKDSRSYPISLVNLGRVLDGRFKNFGLSPHDLKQAIAYHRQALQLFQLSDYPLQPCSLYALGNLYIQAHHSLASDNSDYLAEAMSSFCAATRSLPQLHALRLHLVKKDCLIDVFQTVAQHMQRPGPDFREIQLVGSDQHPHIQIDLRGESVVFQILDPLLMTDGTHSTDTTNNEVDIIYLFAQVTAYYKSLQIHDIQASPSGFLQFLDLVYNEPDVITTRKYQAQNRIKSEGEIKRTYPSRIFAVIIGIDEYDNDQVFDLRGAVSDARAIESYLKDDLGVDKSLIRMLLNGEASRQRIIDSLIALRDNDDIQPGEAILIYYAGHGQVVPAPDGWPGGNVAQCIIPQDFDKDKGIHVIPDRTFVRLIEDIMQERGDNITVILDCCHSGAGANIEDNDRMSCTTLGLNYYYLSPELDKDIEYLSSSDANRSGSPGNGFAAVSSSHVLLAACIANELAHESNGRGQFTRSLVDALQEVSPDQITYCRLMDRLPSIPGQHPVLEGNNMDRTVFNSKAAFRDQNSFTVRLNDLGEYILDAGKAHGVRQGAEFTVYTDNGPFEEPNFDVLVPVVVGSFETVMRPLSQPGQRLNLALAIQTRASVKEGLNVFIQLQEPLILASILMQMKTFKHNRYSIKQVDDPSVAHLALEKGNNGIAIVFVNNSVAVCDLKKSAFEARPHAEDLIPVLQSAAHYHYHLKRSLRYSSSSLREKVKLEFFKLKFSGEVDESSGQLLRCPSGEDLIKAGLITLLLRGGVKDVFGIRITNHSQRDLYPNIFYFDNSELSITQYFGSGGPSRFKVDSPLPKEGGILNLGFGNGTKTTYNFNIPDGQDVAVGFLKCFLSILPVNLSTIATSPSKIVQYPPFEFQSSRARSTKRFRPPPRDWDCICIPVVQHRAK